METKDIIQTLRIRRGFSQEDLAEKVFADAVSTTIAPDAETVEGFNRYVEQFKALLEVERKAVEVI